jgi:PhzF family phenazine biosynthesis protein
MLLYQVDAFTAEPFYGNPAAVCLLDSPRTEAWMQAVAGEMNLSETAFLLPENDGWRLRWFTPAAEVSLCGHATLASAHALWEIGRLERTAQARFYTLSGLLTANFRDGWISMDFPARFAQPADAPAGLCEALGGIEALEVRRWKDNYLVEIESEAGLRALAPDFAALKALPLRGLGVTCRAQTAEFDIVSRYFAPKMAVNEDPVTGSLHCALAPYWCAKLGKADLKAYQASARGGRLGLQLVGERVMLTGQAVTVLRGELIG